MIEPTYRRYDSIGSGYRGPRTPDPRIQAAIKAEWRGARSIVNIGAGAGSYEPSDRTVIAVEPSQTMLAQRPSSAAPATCARAEALPFADGTFDLATAYLTIHHWEDIARGLAEARRVANRVLLLTWIPYPEPFWLMDYFPEIEAFDLGQFPTIEALAEMLGEVDATPVPIPRDCIDGFLCAYWARPRAYLDPEVRKAISSFARLDPTVIAAGIDRLAADLDSGEWERQYGGQMQAESRDYGYRLVSTRASESRGR